VIILDMHSRHIPKFGVNSSSGSMSNWNYGEFLRGFGIEKLLDGLGCNFVIILEMHSGDISPNLVQIPLVLCKIGIMGNFYRCSS